MSILDPTRSSSEHAWAHAEHVAVRHRNERVHPSAQRRAADRRLRPVLITVWIATVTASLLSLRGSADERDAFSVAASAGVLLVLILGVWWMSVTQRFLVRGSARSIRSALPPGSWPSVRRQLKQQEPFDARHGDVIIELAHQQRRLLLGSLTMFLFYVPLYIDIAHNVHGWVGPALVGFGGLALTAGAILTVINHRRLTRVVHRVASPSHGIQSPSTNG